MMGLSESVTSRPNGSIGCVWTVDCASRRPGDGTPTAAMATARQARRRRSIGHLLEPDSTALNQALRLSMGMIFSENRFPLFRDHALKATSPDRALRDTPCRLASA